MSLLSTKEKHFLYELMLTYSSRVIVIKKFSELPGLKAILDN